MYPSQGMILFTATDNTIKSNTVSNHPNVGIILTSCADKNNTIQDNTIDHNDHGIDLFSADSNTFRRLHALQPSTR